MSEPKLRLLKVIIQPVYVLDDGETLTEQATQAATISAVDWPAFAEKSPLEWVQGSADDQSPPVDATESR